MRSIAARARRRRPIVLAGAVFAVVAVLIAFGPGFASRPDPPELLTATPAGFATDRGSNGRLDLDAAARSTVLPTDQLRPVLRRAGFAVGSARRWTRGDDYLQVTAFALRDDAGAQLVVREALAYAAGLPGGGVRAGDAAFLPVPSVPGARGFIANGTATTTDAPLFVRGVWFTRGRVAYLALAGGPQPGRIDVVIELARRQADF